MKSKQLKTSESNTHPDRGLRKALAAQPTYRLPSNFCYRTLQKVKEKEIQRQHRLEQQTLAFLILAAIAFVTAGLFLLREHLDRLSETWNRIQPLDSLSFEPNATESTAEPIFLYGILSLCFLLLATGDHWMRTHYFKHHPRKDEDSKA